MKNRIVFLEETEIEKLFSYFKIADGKYIVRDRALFMLAYYCAMRSSEICKIKMSDVNIQKKEIRCKRMQGGKENSLKIIDDRVYNALCQHYEERVAEGGEDILFISQRKSEMTRENVRQLFRKYCMDVSIEESKMNIRALRYARVVELINKGFSYEELMWWLGITRSECTTIYELYSMITKDRDIYIKLKND